MPFARMSAYLTVLPTCNDSPDCITGVKLRPLSSGLWRLHREPAENSPPPTPSRPPPLGTAAWAGPEYRTAYERQACAVRCPKPRKRKRGLTLFLRQRFGHPLKKPENQGFQCYRNLRKQELRKVASHGPETLIASCPTENQAASAWSVEAHRFIGSQLHAQHASKPRQGFKPSALRRE